MSAPRSVKGFGWNPDVPSCKDWLLGVAHPGLLGQDLPDESEDRRALNPIVRDQGDLGSCVGFSATYGVGWLRRTDRDKFDTTYSPLQLYYDARVMLGPQFVDVDSGAQIRDAMDCLRLTGVAPETKYEYEIQKFTHKPPHTVYEQAARWKLGAHYRCENVHEMMAAAVRTSMR
jgi:hypothetical protein